MFRKLSVFASPGPRGNDDSSAGASQFCRSLACALIALTLTAFDVHPASAQYGNYFYYRNPRTGQSYSFGGVYGDHYYSGGFSYSSRGRTYSNYSGWSGGYGNRRYWGGSQYRTPNYGYGQNWRR